MATAIRITEHVLPTRGPWVTGGFLIEEEEMTLTTTILLAVSNFCMAGAIYIAHQEIKEQRKRVDYLMLELRMGPRVR